MATVKYYVTKRSTGKWAVIRENMDRAAGLFDTKKEAEGYVRSLKSAEIVTSHDSKGKFVKRTAIRKEQKKDDCFITTACTQYYNLPDDCYQLYTLRRFRDSYLLGSNKYESLVRQYYKFAPLIVLKLNKEDNKENLFSEIFNNINKACLLIENEQFEEAKELYSDIVKKLMLKFKII